MAAELSSIARILSDLDEDYDALWDSYHGRGVDGWEGWVDACIFNAKNLVIYPAFSERKEISDMSTAVMRYKTPGGAFKKHSIEKKEVDRILCENLNTLMKYGKDYLYGKRQANTEDKPRIAEIIRQYLKARVMSEVISSRKDTNPYVYAGLAANLRGIVGTIVMEAPYMLLDKHFKTAKSLLKEHEDDNPELHSEEISRNILLVIGECQPLVQMLMSDYKIGEEELRNFANFELEEKFKIEYAELEKVNDELKDDRNKLKKKLEDVSVKMKELEGQFSKNENELKTLRSFENLPEDDIIKKIEELDEKSKKDEKTIENLNLELEEARKIRPIPRFEGNLRDLKMLSNQLSSYLGLEKQVIDLKTTFDEIIKNVRVVLLSEYMKAGDKGPDEDWHILDLSRDIQAELEKKGGTEKAGTMTSAMREYILELGRWQEKKIKQYIQK